MSNGQIVSSDFIISIAVFLIVLVILIPIFTRMTENMNERRFFEDMQTRLIYSADALMKTKGYPDNWNYTNVSRIGLADDSGRLNVTKIRYFLNINPETAKNALGLGGFQFNVSFYRGDYSLMTGVAVSPAAYFYAGEHSMLGAIDSSGLVWDMYFGGSGSAEPGDWRHNYSGPAASLFDSMTNVSEYRTLIVENAGLTQAEVNITALKNFVASGGILILEGDAQLVSSGFLMHANSSANTSGVVKDEVLINAPYSSTVSFNDTQWYFYQSNGDSQLHIAVESSSAPGGAFIGYWNSGIGKIYYVADIDGSVYGSSLLAAVNLVGQKAALSTGIMQQTLAETMTVLYDTDLNSLGKATMVVGI